MAEKDCLSADGAGEHAAGDTVCFSGRNTRSAWRSGFGRGDWDYVLGDGGSFGSDGWGGAATAPPCGMVPGHHFLFSRIVFFLQDADVKKNRRTRRVYRNVCAPTTSSVT